MQFSKQQFSVSIVLFIHTNIEKTHTYRFQEKIQKVSFMSFRAFFKAEFWQINLSDNFRTRGFSNFSKVTEKFSKKRQECVYGLFFASFWTNKTFSRYTLTLGNHDHRTPYRKKGERLFLNACLLFQYDKIKVLITNRPS